MGTAQNFSVTITEDATQFTDATLRPYEVVVMLHPDGEGILNAAQRTAFERWLQRGKGLVGIHAAANADRDWDWMADSRGGSLFLNHPSGANQFQQATVKNVDPNHPAMQGIPADWVRTDEWYNFTKEPQNVHVLAKLDESTYDGGGRLAGGRRPPDRLVLELRPRPLVLHRRSATTAPPGRSRCTASTSRARSSGPPGATPGDCGAPRDGIPTDASFDKVTLDDNTENPMEIAIAPGGNVYFVELAGKVKYYNATTRSVRTVGTIPVHRGNENGLLGIALDPNFATNKWLYLFYSAPSPEEQHVSRFTVGADGNIDMASEKVLLKIPHQRIVCCHSAGSLTFGPGGLLLHLHRRRQRARRVAGLRPDRRRRPAQQPGRQPGRRPRVRLAPHLGQHERPARQDPAHQAGARRHVQRSRRATSSRRSSPIRPRPSPRSTRWATATRSGSRSTRRRAGSTTARSARTPTARTPTAARAATTSSTRSARRATWAGRTASPTTRPTATGTSPRGPAGETFDCAGGPNNTSNYNTGLAKTPPTTGALLWWPYSPYPAGFPWATAPTAIPTGSGRTAIAGPIYHFNPAATSDTKLPEYYDDKVFFADWSRDWIATADARTPRASPRRSARFLPNTEFRHPQDIEMGPDGTLYVLEWGRDFNYAGSGINPDSGLYRIDYVKGSRTPVAKASADKDSGGTPLTVAFSSAGSEDPDGDALTYEWDFGDGTPKSTAANPQHTFTQAGNYTVQLTVTDTSGKAGTSSVVITVGNTRPTVMLDIPQGGVYGWGDEIAYKVTVTDPEDGTIDCNKVVVSPGIFHDEGGNAHVHPGVNRTGLRGHDRRSSRSPGTRRARTSRSC